MVGVRDVILVLFIYLVALSVDIVLAPCKHVTRSFQFYSDFVY